MLDRVLSSFHPKLIKLGLCRGLVIILARLSKLYVFRKNNKDKKVIVYLVKNNRITMHNTTRGSAIKSDYKQIQIKYAKHCIINLISN